MRVQCRDEWIGKLAILVIPPEMYAHISSEMPQEMVNEWGMEGIFVSANKPYFTVEEAFKKFGILEKIIFVDCASRLAGENPSGKRLVVIDNPSDFTHLTESITQAVDGLGEKKFLVFDSLTTLLIYSESSHLTRFAHTLGLIMKTRKVTSLFLAVDSEYTKEILTFLASIADKYVHLGIDEEGEVSALEEPTERTLIETPAPLDRAVSCRVSVAVNDGSIDKPFNVFLCYKKSSGKDFADHLKRGLEEFGLHTFLDSKDIRQAVDGQEEWAKARDKAIQESTFFVLIMTPGFEKSSEVLKEIELARKLGNKHYIYFRYRSMSRKIVIPQQKAQIDISKQEQVSFETKEEILRLAINILTRGKT